MKSGTVTIIKVNGKGFRCSCGCNVFIKIDKTKYKCNVCGKVFKGNKE